MHVIKGFYFFLSMMAGVGVAHKLLKKKNQGKDNNTNL